MMSKAVFITGANGGIGQALCRAFVESGYFVIASDKVASTCACNIFIQADLETLCTNPQYRTDIFATVGRHRPEQGMFALVNNAAIQILGKTEQVTVEHWYRT